MNLEDTINDCYVDLKGKQPSESEIQEIKNNIPNDILMIGQQWGWYDTEFRDKLYNWLKGYIS